MTARLAWIVSLAVLAGCETNFEDPSIVIDLRVLSINAEPPEVVSDFDPDNPLATELPDVELCALVADPNESRGLRYNMVTCPPTRSRRCDEPEHPFVEMGFGTVADPEESADEIRMCATIPGDARLFPIIETSIEEDNLSGFGGIPIQVEMWAMPEAGQFPDDAVFAVKEVLFAPRIPAERVPNTNPHLDGFTVTRAGGSQEPLPLGRCGQIAPLEVSAGEEIEIFPLEPDGVREDYVVPTFDGGVRTFTENLRYAWLATAGNWAPDNTGGPKDAVGNVPKLETNWTAPDDPEVVGAGLDVRVWIVQRDERGGNAAYQSCLRVLP